MTEPVTNTSTGTASKAASEAASGSTRTRPYRVAFIGSGGRSFAYAAPYVESPDVEIAALADPNPAQRASIRKSARVPEGVPEYDDWRKMLRELDDLDGAVISSPTAFHVEQAIACFERGLPVALEKPIAASPGECERLLDAERANNGRTLVGFVLRSTPFFSTVHKIVSEGRIGRILSLQADELPGWGVTSVMFRSPWRRHAETSGGSMLEKCCHDMDMMNWLLGARPVSLNSFGGLRVMGPNPELPDYCSECRVADTCKYFQDPADTSEDAARVMLREEYRCVYNIDKSVMDVQSVNLEYENGAVANFMLNFHAAGPRAGRNLHLVGTRGRLWGNMEESSLSVYDNRSDRVENVALHLDASGHGGGDNRHALLLLRMMQDPAFRPGQNAQAGYLSAIMSFAADRSVRECRRVDLDHHDDGRVEIL